MKYSIFQALALSALLLFSSCLTFDPPPPPELRLSLDSNNQLNLEAAAGFTVLSSRKAEMEKAGFPALNSGNPLNPLDIALRSGQRSRSLPDSGNVAQERQGEFYIEKDDVLDGFGVDCDCNMVALADSCETEPDCCEVKPPPTGGVTLVVKPGPVSTDPDLVLLALLQRGFRDDHVLLSFANIRTQSLNRGYQHAAVFASKNLRAGLRSADAPQDGYMVVRNRHGYYVAALPTADPGVTLLVASPRFALLQGAVLKHLKTGKK